MEDLYVDFDQPRRLFIGLQAAKALSRVSDGHGLIYINNKLNEFDVPTLEAVLWAAMSKDEPSLTLSLVAKRVETYFEREKTLFPLFMAAGKAINDSGMFNQPKEETVAGNPKTATDS